MNILGENYEGPDVKNSKKVRAEHREELLKFGIMKQTFFLQSFLSSCTYTHN